MRHYRHTQVGYVIIAVTAGLAAVFTLTNRAMLASGAGPGLWPLTIFPALLLLFGTLTVMVDEREVRLHFGIGLIRKTIPLSEVRGYSVVTNRWLWGWGIRACAGGTLYNVSGLKAVELRLASGRFVRIGTDQPHALEAAIRAIVGHPQPLSPGEAVLHPRTHRLATALGWVVGVGLLGFVTWIAVMMYREPRPPRVKLTADVLSVESFLYRADVPLADVTAVSLVECLPGLRRTSGFSAAGILRGHFDVRGLGNGLLFVDIGNPPFLVLRSRSGFVIVGLEDPARTRALYVQVQAAWTRTGPR